MPIDFKKLTEPFTADQIDHRPGRAGLKMNGEPFLPLIPYIDSRAVQNRLDEVVGSAGWGTKISRLIDGVGFICELSLEVEPGKWVTKAAAADDTEYEKVKGGDSRALVRAACLWGIGRYLYDIPTVWAEFVPKGTQGAKRIEISGKEFYYMIPEIELELKADDVVPDDEPLFKEEEQVKAEKPVKPPQAKDYSSPFAGSIPAKMQASTVSISRPIEKPQPVSMPKPRKRKAYDPGTFQIKWGAAKKPLSEFTPEELEALENWIYLLQNPKPPAVKIRENLEAFLGRKLQPPTSA